MEDLSLNIPMKFLFDLPAWNAIIGQIKKSLGDTLGKNIKPIDETAWRKSMNDAAAASTKFMESQKGLEKETKKVGEELDKTSQKSSTFKGVVSGVLAGAGISFGMGALIEGIKGVGGAMITGNQEMETYKTQLGTLMGSSKAAEERLAELAKFGAETPFELPELVRAEKVLIGFGLQGQKAFKLTGESATDLRTIVGDVAAGVGVPFEELALSMGKFSSGATGEAIARLQELGIVTKEQLSEVGIQFDKAGSLVSPLPDAMTAAVKIMKEKFGGGMAALSQTAGGQMSTLSDNISSSLRSVGTGLFDTFKEAITGLNAALSSEGTQKAIQDVAKAAGEFVKILVDIVKTAIQLAPVIGGIAVVAGTMYAVMNAGMIVTRAVTAAQWLWNVALNANPIGLVIAGVVGLIAVTKILSSSLKETAADREAELQVEKDLVETKKKDNLENQKRLENNNNLIKRYEELGKKTNKTKAESEEYRKIMIELNKEYPNVIKGTDDFKGSLDRLKDIAAQNVEKIKSLKGAFKELALQGMEVE
ncbi:hypothetical protein EG832_09855, partial [bacterium]|nr:hypothetical protein [bacterium]